MRADVGAGHVQVAAGHQHGAVAGEGDPGPVPSRRTDGVRGLARQEAARLVVHLVAGRTDSTPAIRLIAPRAHGQLLAGGDVRARALTSWPATSVGCRRDGGADFLAGAQGVAVARVQREAFTMAFGQGAEVDVAPSLQTRVVLTDTCAAVVRSRPACMFRLPASTRATPVRCEPQVLPLFSDAEVDVSAMSRRRSAPPCRP